MTIIYISRKKVLRIQLGACVILALSLYLILQSKFVQTEKVRPPGVFDYVIFGIGCLGLLFFARATYVAVPLLLKKRRPYVSIDERGITDLYTKTGRMVSWGEVSEVTTAGRKSNPVVLVKLKNPESYIHTTTSPSRKKIAQFRLKKYGTPVVLENRVLETNADSLIGFIQLYRPDTARELR